MPSTKTLRVTLQDIVGGTGGSGSTAVVRARYVTSNGQGRDVHLADGTIVVPVRRSVTPGTGPERFDFTVIPSDDADGREVDRGFLTEVSWTVTAPEGGKSHGVRRVLITADMGATVHLGLLSTPAPLPGYTGGYVTPETYAALVARVVELEAAPGGGGSGGTLTADDTPAAPAEGESATYFVTSAVSWPVGLVWSTDPDGGVEPTITDAALVSMFTLDGTTYAVLGSTFPVIVAPDVTAPTAGTLSVTAFASTTINVSVAGASDETALHATPYAFSSDNGGTYSAYQPGATYGLTGLTASTSYTLRHRVRDAAGNVTVGTAVVQATDAAPADSTPPTVGTLAGSSITSSGFTLTVSGAADEAALHATPYRFSTDNGATYSAYQSSAVYAATGLAASTGYTCKHQTRDAAGNVSTGTGVLVTTGVVVFAPDDLAALSLWLDASDAATIADTGGTVTSWTDKAVSRVFNGTTGATTGAASVNGLNVVTFANAYLTSSASASAWEYLHNEQVSVIAVATFGAIADPNASYSLIGTNGASASSIGMTVIYDDRAAQSTNDALWIGNSKGTSLTWVYHTFSSGSIMSSSAKNLVVPNAPAMLAILSDPTNATIADRLSIHVAGSLTGVPNQWTGTTGAPDGNPPTYTLQIGAAGNGVSPLTGQIAELIVTSGLLSETDRQKLEGYLAHKWALTASLPAGHPYKSVAP